MSRRIDNPTIPQLAPVQLNGQQTFLYAPNKRNLYAHEIHHTIKRLTPERFSELSVTVSLLVSSPFVHLEQTGLLRRNSDGRSAETTTLPVPGTA